MSSRYGAAICHKLAEKTQILEIVDFGDGQIFPDRTTYTCTITFAKKPRTKLFSVTSFPSGLDWREDVLHTEKAQITEIPTERLLSHPWNLTNEIRNEIISKMHHQDFPTVQDVFSNICQGVRTGANPLFLLDRSDTSQIEESLLLPYINGQNIRKCKILPSNNYLLYPYRRNGSGDIEPIPEHTLAKDFPNAWSYFLHNRRAFSERDLDFGSPWYGYSRTQNLEIQHLPKVLVKEMMPSAEFAADVHGEFAISSGYALVASPNMTKEEIKLWTAVLSTPTMEFQLRLVGTQLHSGWFRLMGHHLKRVKLPIFEGPNADFAYSLAATLHQNVDDNKAWDELDMLVAKAFTLTPEMREEIVAFLHQAHTASKPTSQNYILATVNTELSRAIPEPTTAYPELNEEQTQRYLPVELPQFNRFHRQREDLSRLVTFVSNKTDPINRWYSYTQGYSELLVKKLLEELNVKKTDIVYDPFVGCGTTLLTCRALGIASFGLEISPLMSWVTSLKVTSWNVQDLQTIVAKVAIAQPETASAEHLLFFDYLQRAYSPFILEQLVGWRNWISTLECETTIRQFLLLALVSILEDVSNIRKHGSHYRFLNKEESIGLDKLNISTTPSDTEIKPIFIRQIKNMIEDVEKKFFLHPLAPCDVITGDARRRINPDRVADIVITSPPYLNRNNYLAQQKAELSIMDMLPSYKAYKQLVQSTFRSHVESDFSVQPQTTIPEVAKILEVFELTPNNNPKIPHMIAGYFEDIKNTLDVLFHLVKPGGMLAFVVGNSRWGGVVIPVDHLLSLLAERRGFVIERILVTRLKGNSPQQMRRYGRIPVRESIVIFRRP